MPDFYGSLQLPVPVPAAGAAVSDPLLDTVLTYLKAVINFETKAAWQAVCPPRRSGEAESLPVTLTAAHDPDGASFSTNKLPGLFAWRDETPATDAFRTQGWDVVDSPISLMWVPPPAPQEKDRLREPFRNAVEKAIRKALKLGRHPAWVVADDTYSNAPVRGSVFLKHARAMRARLGPFTRKPLFIEDESGGRGTAFRTIYTTLIVREAFVQGYERYQPLNSVRGSFELGTPGLTINPFQFQPSFDSVEPSSGPVAGGTSITLLGAQFFSEPALGDITVTVGGVACTDVAFVDAGVLTATTPAGTLGAKDVVLTLPNGIALTRVAAFTYV